MQGEIEWQRHKPVSHPERAKVGTAVQPYRLVFSIGQLHAEGEVGWWYVERGSSGSGSREAAFCRIHLQLSYLPSVPAMIVVEKAKKDSVVCSVVD